MKLKLGFAILLLITANQLGAQTHYNVWLTTCSRFIGLTTGDPGSLKLAVDQSRGLAEDAPGFDWDVLIDLGDWTASQKPPGHEEGNLLAKCLNETLGRTEGQVFHTLAGNHDGDPKGWIPGTFASECKPLGESEF